MKKILLLFLALCLLVFSASCGGSGGAASKAQTEGKAKKAVDLNGYKFTWASLWEPEVYPVKGSSDYGDKRLELIQKVEEDYNCHISFTMLAGTNVAENMNIALMAGEKFYDFIETTVTGLPTHLKNKTLMPLNTIKGFDVTQDKFLEDFTKQYTGEDVNVYGVQYSLSKLARNPAAVMFFNKDLLEKYGLPSPYELVKKDQWTFEKFAEMCKALTKENQWGVTTVDWHYNHMEKPFIFANNAGVVKEKDGKYRFGLLEPNAQYALNYLNKLIVQDKCMAPRPDINTPQDAFDAFTSGKVGFMSYSTINTWRLNQQMTDEWGLVVIPKGPNATDYVHISAEYHAWVMLKNNVEDAEKAAIVFDALSEPVTGSRQTDEEMFWNEYLYSLNGDKDALEQLKLASKTTVRDYSWCLNETQTKEFTAALDTCLRSGSKTPKAAMEAIAPVMQGYINGVYE